MKVPENAPQKVSASPQPVLHAPTPAVPTIDVDIHKNIRKEVAESWWLHLLRKLSLQVKLVSAFLVAAALVILVSYFNLQAISSILTSFDHIIDNYVPRLSILKEMRTVAIKLKVETELYQARQPGAESEAQKRLFADLKDLSDLEKEYTALATKVNDEQRQRVSFEYEQVAIATAKINSAVTEFINLKQGGAPAVVAAKGVDLIRAENDLDGILTAALDKDYLTIKTEDAAATTEAKRQRTFAILIAALASAFALLLGMLISASIARNLKKLKDGAVRVAVGDFSHSIIVKTHDELSQLATAFNQMSLSLQESYRRLDLEKSRDEAIMHGMSDGLVAVDTSTRVMLMNQVAATLLGVTDIRATVGKPAQEVYAIYGKDDKGNTPLPASERPMMTAITTGNLASGIYTFRTAEGGKRLISITATPVKLDGKVAGAIAVLRDVTKEKEIDRMKTEFISLASHQLRTPLSAIKWFSEMLLSGDAGKLSDEQTEFTKNISDSTERMIQLVNSLLNISRIESGRIIIDPKPTDLSELVAGIVNDLKGKTEERKQTLIVSVHHDLPKVNLDPRMISQVYMNLLTNAIKYTPKGGEISVFVSRKGADLLSQITDNGYGIPKAEQARTFQKFFRAENIKKVETDGTGLGLYLIKAIIESSGGKIWFESEEGKGTTFWFSLPMTGMLAKEGEVTLDM